MRDSFVFYRSFFEAIEQADAETQLKLYRAIADYALNGVEPEFTGMAKIAWMLVKMLMGATSSPTVKAASPSGTGGKLTRQEAAVALGVNSCTLWRWVKRGHLHPVRIGGKTFYKEEEVAEISRRGLSVTHDGSGAEERNGGTAIIAEAPKQELKIGNRRELIRQLFKDYNIKSQSSLARILGVSQQWISKALSSTQQNIRS